MNSSARTHHASSRRHRAGRLAAAAAVGVLGTATVAAPSWGAAPSNDEPTGATAVHVGDHVNQDTTQATTTAADAADNANCGAPATDASVWYTYTAATDGGVILDASSSSFSAGFMVFEGAPAASSEMTCGPGTIEFDAAAGSTYTVMVFDDQTDGNPAAGGNLALDVVAAPPAPTADATVNPRAQVDKSGTAWVTGSYSCTNADNIELDGELHQSVGRTTINGYGFSYDENTCDGSSHPFTMPISGENGKFAGGKAASIVFSYACGSYDCSFGYNEQRIQLSKGR